MLVIKQNSSEWSERNQYKIYLWIGETQGTRLNAEGEVMRYVDCYNLSEDRKSEFTEFIYDDRE